MTRVDSQVDFYWWDGSPSSQLQDDDFGVRWSGFLQAPATGSYQLGAIGLNAFELYVDGKTDREVEQHPRIQLSIRTRDAGSWKAIRHSLGLSRVCW